MNNRISNFMDAAICIGAAAIVWRLGVTSGQLNSVEAGIAGGVVGYILSSWFFCAIPLLRLVSQVIVAVRRQRHDATLGEDDPSQMSSNGGRMVKASKVGFNPHRVTPSVEPLAPIPTITTEV